MEYRKIGKSGIEASKICLGTWSVGGGPFWGGDTSEDEAFKAIRYSIDAGINFIDTAPAYGFGRSEKILGKAIKGIRDKVIISTKCGLWWRGEEGTPAYEQEGYVVRKSLKPATIRQEIEKSLTDLGTDYIDLYITHWPEVGEDATPIYETIDFLKELKKAGKIRAIGASNVSLDEIKEYNRYGDLDAVQLRYTMLDRHLEPDYISLCETEGISIMSYSTIEMGLLTGKVGIGTSFSEGDFRNFIPWMKIANRTKVLSMIKKWDDLQEKYDCSLVQLVIAWTAGQRGITFPIVGARRLGHAEENAEAGKLILEKTDLNRMRADVEALGSPE